VHIQVKDKSGDMDTFLLLSVLSQTSELHIYVC
jgi:hypothetical protein